MKTYKYPQSREIFERALKVIPAGVYGHLGPSNGCFIPVSAYPFYAKNAKGAYLWDVDGNRFIDYMCAYGPIITGYNNERVDNAAQKQRQDGDCMLLPSEKMVELAELMVDTVESADWAFFAKNGGDVTNLAILTARAYTNRKKIIKFNGGYHGVVQWTQSLGNPGIIEEDINNIISIDFNDINSFKDTVKKYKGQIACLIATPYHHPAMADNALPKKGYWKEIRDICTNEGIVLIIDDVRCGFRLDVKGSDYYYGFKADLICFCKSLANGYNISALCGQEFLKSYCSDVFYTGSYWLSAVPMAAAIENIKQMVEIDSANIVTKKGIKLTKGLEKVAIENGFNLIITGEPSMWYMRLDNDESGVIHQRWIAECVKRGVFFTSHHNMFINTMLSDEDIDFTLKVADKAFKIIRKENGG